MNKILALNKKTNGITLIELLIAISLLALILLAGSGIYLSGWQMFRQAQLIAQAQRNAMIPMAHMVKNLQQATYIGSYSHTTTFIKFIMDDNNTPNIQTDDDTVWYTFDNTAHTITYQVEPYPLPSVTTTTTIGTHIDSCSFTHVEEYNPLVIVSITATDNSGGNQYALTTTIESRYFSGYI